MYKYKSEKFGDFLKYTFFDTQTNNSFSVVPEHGACVLEVEIDGQSIVDGHENVEEMLNDKWFKSTILFPFPNRLKKGSYSFEGKTYQFPINEPATNNALHGFANNPIFTIENINCDADFAEIHCRCQNKGMDPAYPFAFSFEVKLKISNPGSFEIEFLFKNEDSQKIPVGLGWHPYFNCFDDLDQASLQCPDCQYIDIDEFAIPNKERFDYSYFKKMRKIRNAVLDNAFELAPKESRAEVVLQSDRGKLIYWQDTGLNKFNYLQIFTPSHRKSIAIEPMTCNIDAFNNGDGLIVLKPGDQCTMKCGFSFSTT